MLCVLMVEGMSVVVNVMLSLMMGVCLRRFCLYMNVGWNICLF